MRIQDNLSVHGIKAVYPDHFEAYTKLCEVHSKAITDKELTELVGIVSVQLYNDDLHIQCSPKVEDEDTYIKRIRKEIEHKIRFEIVPCPTVLKTGVKYVPPSFDVKLVQSLRAAYASRIKELEARQAEDDAIRADVDSAIRNREESINKMQVLTEPQLGKIVEVEGRRYVGVYGPVLAEHQDGRLFTAILCISEEIVRKCGPRPMFSQFFRKEETVALYVALDGKTWSLGT